MEKAIQVSAWTGANPRPELVFKNHRCPEERNGPLREAVAMRVAELHNFRVAEVGRRAVVADAQGANLAGPGRADEDARPRAGRGDVQRRQHRASNMPSIDAANEFL